MGRSVGDIRLLDLSGLEIVATRDKLGSLRRIG
jgi:hypothetical protein